MAVVRKDELRAVLATCASRELEDLRDQAIILMLHDTGLRRAGLLGLRWRISISTSGSPSSPARAAASVHARTASRPAWPSTGALVQQGGYECAAAAGPVVASILDSTCAGNCLVDELATVDARSWTWSGLRPREAGRCTNWDAVP